jgi:CRP-like cAMP-binding protein
MNSTTPHREGANELYEMLSPELRAELCGVAQTSNVPRGACLIQHGLPPDHLVIVNSGKVEITLHCARAAASLGNSEAGKVFGMRALLSGELPEIDVTCTEPCSITKVPRDVFLALLKAHPEIYFAVAKVLSSDLRIADRILRNNPRRSVAGPRSSPMKAV